jgi:hypothetical protein
MEHKMGFRFELKAEFKPLVSPEEHKEIAAQLKEAQEKADKHNVFYDVERNQDKASVRKKLLYVAEREDLPLRIRSERKINSLRLTFDTAPQTKRMTAPKARSLILKTLRAAKKPLSRQDIIKQTGITGSSWNLRIKELTEEGMIKRIGRRKQTQYRLP